MQNRTVPMRTRNISPAGPLSGPKTISDHGGDSPGSSSVKAERGGGKQLPDGQNSKKCMIADYGQ